MTKVDISILDGVPQTLLIPLMGRALESQKRDGILNDPKSVSIFNQIDYDFDKFNNPSLQSSLFRTVVRTTIIDHLVLTFFEEQSSATIIEIGCGLNTRFERLDNGKIQWFDLDVPEVYNIWKKFFVETDRHHFLATSAFDEDWLRQVKTKSQGPYFFISEASVTYFSEQKVKTLFTNLHNYFPRSHYLFDAASPGFLNDQKKSSISRKYFNAHYKWFLKDLDTLKTWLPEMKILKSINLERPDEPFASLYPQNFILHKQGAHLNLVQI